VQFLRWPIHYRRLAAACLSLTIIALESLATGIPAYAGNAAPAITAPAVEAAKHRVSFQGGIAAPLGFGGVAWAYAPSSTFRVETGLGFGVTGVQFSVMPMVVSRLSARNRSFAGAGLSWAFLNSYNCGVQRETADPSRMHLQNCFWLNIDAAGLEHVMDNGLSLFAAAGLTVPFQRVSLTRMFYTEPFIPLPQAKLGVGWWF
jgi:hypothetical protein